ncbi:MAG: hypothetical protein AAGJ17_00010 [Pseudomonadota bacterium]
MNKVAIKKINEMIKSPRFVKIVSVTDKHVVIQNKVGYQQIDNFGRVYNVFSLDELKEINDEK